jgi:hypothetical protein
MDQSGELKGSPTGLVGVAWCVVKCMNGIPLCERKTSRCRENERTVSIKGEKDECNQNDHRNER